ncbi:Cytochrome P450 4C1, partial [Blattella germanica]
VILSSSKHLDKSYGYDFLHPWLGKGLLTSTGQKWHTHRKMITPTFHFKILDSFVEVFTEKSEIMISKLQKEVGNKGFDVYPYITKCALDIICETAMGTQIFAQDDGNSEYVRAVYDMSEITIKRLLRPWLHPDIIFKFSSLGKQHDKSLRVLHGFTSQGHDTTSAGMTWAIYLLGLHPDIQEKAFKEQEAIFQGSQRAATMKDLNEMKYLERVLKEALRLYPSVPTIGRMTTEECKLEFFPDPEKFDPDRFLPEAVAKRHPYAYLPFSAGPRNCIGQKFALLEEKAVLSSFIRNYKVSSLDKREDLKLISELVLRPENGIRITMTARNAKSAF